MKLKKALGITIDIAILHITGFDLRYVTTEAKDAVEIVRNFYNEMEVLEHDGYGPFCDDEQTAKK